MRFVPKKTLEQQDIQALHRARQRLVNHRTALISQMRGLLLDRGIAIAVSATRARRLIPKIRAVPRQDKLDRSERLRKREFWAHLNRARSGDENESGCWKLNRYEVPTRGASLTL